MRIPDGDSWKIRVTPNKFSALSPDVTRERKNEDGRHIITGFGKHEVIIESPVHNMSIAGMPVDDIADLLRTYSEEVRRDL